VARCYGTALLIVALTLLVPFITGPRAAATEAVLPEALAGWTAAGAPQVFIGDDLFRYINGGAELYHEYGFVQVEVRDYRKGEDRIAVEVYTMSGAAYGIFSLTRPGSGTPVDLGNAGRLGEYYLSFWSGPCLVVVTAQTGFSPARPAVLSVGEALAARFPPRGREPDLVARLPAAHRRPGSETFVTGPLALRRTAPQAARFFTGFDRAASAQYEVGAAVRGLIVLLDWDDPGAAAAAMDEARRRAGVERGPEAPDRFEVAGENGEALGAARRGGRITLAVSADGRKAVRRLLTLAHGSTEVRR
jgi:hypothetical protein